MGTRTTGGMPNNYWTQVVAPYVSILWVIRALKDNTHPTFHWKVTIRNKKKTPRTTSSLVQYSLLQVSRMLIATFGVGIKYYYTNSKSFSNGELHSKCGLELQNTVKIFFSHRRRSCPSVFWNVTDVHFSLRSSVALYALSDVSAYNSGTIFSGWMYGQSRTWTDPYKSRGESGVWFSQTWYKLLGGKEINQTLLRLCPYLRWSHGQTSISSTVKTHTNRGKYWIHLFSCSKR